MLLPHFIDLQTLRANTAHLSSSVRYKPFNIAQRNMAVIELIQLLLISIMQTEQRNALTV